MQDELRLGKTAKTTEFEAIKASVVQNFDIPEAQQPSKVLPWVERCVLSMRIDSIGIAVPLEDYEIEAPWLERGDDQGKSLVRPAFLVSTTSLAFGASRFSAGFARMTDLSAQFVRAFDQTKPQDFSGFHHRSQNRLAFPDTELRITSSTSETSNYIVTAEMSGARMDLDASIVSSVSSLLDLYEISRRRFAKYAAIMEKEKSTANEAAGTAPDTSRVDMTTFEASFVVGEGIINIYNSTKLKDPPAADSKPHNRWGRPAPPRKPSIFAPRHQHSIYDDAPGTDRFKIPRFSMWAIKKAAKYSGGSSNVHLDATIHASSNVLTPALLPFVSEAADAAKARLQTSKVPESPTIETASLATALNRSTAALDDQATSGSAPNDSLALIRNLYITFSLKIDESSLQLTCVPTADAIGRLEWKSGSLLVGFQPGRRLWDISASIEQVGFSLKQA